MTQSILITGCSSGIGKHCAEKLKDRGWQVFATARKESDVTLLRNAGFESFRLDYADSESLNDGTRKVLDATKGKLSAVFHNGAYGLPGAIEDVSREAWRAQFETNFFGWMELTSLLLPSMRENGKGRVVFNSSVLGFIALPYRGAYNASKFALEGAVDTLRMELTGSGIDVSLIEPGPIESRFRENSFAMFKKNIDVENSLHKERYKSLIDRLEKKGPAVPFTLGPEAVYKPLLHALESRRPKTRYRVTFPTSLFHYLKKIVPTRLLDSITAKL